jgi:hypothetical protein
MDWFTLPFFSAKRGFHADLRRFDLGMVLAVPLVLLLLGVMPFQGAEAAAPQKSTAVSPVKPFPAPLKSAVILMRLQPKGPRLYLEAKPSPARLDFKSAGRRLGTLPGKGKILFDITTFARRAADGRLRVTAYHKSGKGVSRTFNVSNYTARAKPKVQPKVPAAPVAPYKPTRRPAPPSGGESMESLSSRYRLPGPREPSSGAESGRRAPPSMGFARPSPPVPTPPPIPGGLPGGRERGGRGFAPPTPSGDDEVKPPSGFAQMAAPRAPPGAAAPASPMRQALPERDYGDMARITDTDPKPAIVGRPLYVRGVNLGTSGRATLDLGGLRLQLHPRGDDWSDNEVVLELSDELGPLLGSEEQAARIWLYAERNTASASIRLTPDPATLAPIIRRAPASVHPGVEITVNGDRFFDTRGSVELNCPGGGVTSEVRSWSNTRILVTPAAAFSRRLRSADCELAVRNHHGVEVRRPMRLDVELARDTLGASGYHNFAESYPPYFEIVPRRLLNGWLVVGSSFQVEPDGALTRFFWRDRPPNNQPEVFGSVNGENVGLHSGGPPRGRRRIMMDFELEGPRGLPYGAGFSYPDW